jgi:transcriptional regulator with PAS, ATPase and Fis domain
LKLLAASFLAASEPPRQPSDIPDPIWDMFLAHRWPGNVRELKNAVRRVLVTPEQALERTSEPGSGPDHTTPQSSEIVPLRIARQNAMETFERNYVKAILAKSGGNVTRAADLADVSRQIIHKLIMKHGL